MKKFLIKILIYIALLSSITLCINETYKGHGTDLDKFMRVPKGIQLCNLGSSHGLNGFNYNDINRDYVCFNFSLGGQSLPYDYRILKNYADNLSNNAVVFIVVSYFSFFGPNDTQSRNFASKNRTYYAFLPPELIQEYDAKTDFYVNYFPALTDEKIVSVVKHIYSFLFEAHEEPVTNAYSQERAEQDAANIYRRHVALNVDIHGNRMLKHDALEAVYKIIRLCRDRGARPILVTTPYLYEYIDMTRKCDAEFFEDFYGIIDKIVKDTNVEYYDYSERFGRAYDMFSDDDHLNDAGASIFTNTLLSEVLGIEAH